MLADVLCVSSLAPAGWHAHPAVPVIRILQTLVAVVLIVVAVAAAGAVSAVLLGPAPDALSTYVPSQVSTACGDYVAVQAGEYGAGAPAPSVQCEEPLPR